MTHRERWVRVMHFQPVDHIPDEEFGAWNENFPVWQEQGLPKDVNNNSDFDRYFQFAPRSGIPANVGLSHGFKSEVLEDTDQYRIYIDGNGVKQQVFKDGSSSIPHYLEFPLKDRKSWEELFLPRLEIELESRYPENRSDWEQIKARYSDPGWSIPVGITIGSLFGWIRNWAGFEGVSMLCYDDPDLVKEMVSHLAALISKVIHRAVHEIKIDYAAGWEDIAFNHGPILSPKMFREFVTPNYRRIADTIREANPDAVIYTDCDGNINDLIEPWLEGGINGLFPVESAAGSDPIAIRKKYGDRVVMLGGVNKRALIAGKEAIKEELERIKPYVDEGGWIPHVDHRVPPDVTFENYVYYLHLKREMFGIPHPEEFESRPEIKAIKAKWKGVL